MTSCSSSLRLNTNTLFRLLPASMSSVRYCSCFGDWSPFLGCVLFPSVLFSSSIIVCRRPYTACSLLSSSSIFLSILSTSDKRSSRSDTILLLISCIMSFFILSILLSIEALSLRCPCVNSWS